MCRGGIMRAIITGGAGFIGSNLISKIVSSNEFNKIIVLDNLSTGNLLNLKEYKDDIDFMQIDISVSGEWQNIIQPNDVIFHLAALADIIPSVKYPEKYFSANVTGTFNLLEACREKQIRKLIYSASSSCYGIPDEYPTSELAPIKPQYPYALTKRLGEELVIHYAKVYKIPANSLRFFNVYGPNSRTTGTYGAMFGVFMAQLHANKPMTVVGDGTQTRDFTHVNDVCDAIIAAKNIGTDGEIYNIGSSKTVSVNYITQLLGGEVVHIPKRPGEPDCTFADISKFTMQTGWRPKISIESGIKDLIKRKSYWENAPVWDPSSIEKATEDWFKYLNIDN